MCKSIRGARNQHSGDIYDLTGLEQTISFSKPTALPLSRRSGIQKIELSFSILLYREPGLVVLVQSTDDVRKSVMFAREHNLRVTIFSSGHDFIGRSTRDGTLQMNLSNMKNVTIDLSSPLNTAGIITVESGAQWVEVYKKVRQKRNCYYCLEWTSRLHAISNVRYGVKHRHQYSFQKGP